MAYLHIKDFYKAKNILFFKECFALEKIHGTSAHMAYKNNNLTFFSASSKQS